MLFTILHNSGSEEEFELLLLIALRRRRKKESNMWVRPIFSLRRKQGEYNLLQEMRLADREAHFLHIQVPRIATSFQAFSLASHVCSIS